ncbi:MAG TPA: ROK family transcriptional regulator [Mycobacteriales bacterium]|nr:ROK family transcriptional regulator [Mycobacteriales bacterium]
MTGARVRADRIESGPWTTSVTGTAARTPAVTQEEVRRHNLGVLLRQLHVRGAMSRADLTAVSGLNRSTVRALTTELADAGLVRQAAPVGRGGAGRPSILVEPRSEHVWALAVDIGVEHLAAARIGLGGVVLDRREVWQPRGDGDVPQVLDRVRALVEPLLATAAAEPVGIGVAVPGMVGGPDQLVRFAPNLGWIDVPLGTLLGVELDTMLPVAVGNEGDLGVMAEHLRGVATDASDAIYLTGEVGLGAGVIVGGRPLTGAGGYAGEVGHMSVNPATGRLCTCGRRGCWETEVGADAVLLAIGAPPGSAPAEILAQRAGDRASKAAVRRVGRWLGVGVANLVNLFNPEVVIFGGLTRELFPLLEPYVRAELATSLTAPRDQVRLALPGLGADSSLVGAAELAFAPLLGDPLGARA